MTRGSISLAPAGRDECRLGRQGLSPWWVAARGHLRAHGTRAALLSPFAFAFASPAAASPGNGHRDSQRVTQIPISFEARNVNRSEVAYASDGAT